MEGMTPLKALLVVYASVIGSLCLAIVIAAARDWLEMRRS